MCSHHVSRDQSNPGESQSAFADTVEPSSTGRVRSHGDAIDYDERQTMHAWEDFLSGNLKRSSGSRLPVRPLILDSWHRSASDGINAASSEAPLKSDRSEIEYLRRANSELLAAARQSFDNVGKLLEGSRAMLVLTDSDGVLIQTIGDRQTIHDGMDIHLGIGGKWNEETIGTNGIGTALWSGAPAFVHAAEHFCAGIKNWTCAGAPLCDPFDGKIIGCVDLSGYSTIFRPHNLALVAAVAREIEAALADQQHEERSRLLEIFISTTNKFRSKDGLVIVDRHGRAVYCNNVPKDAAEHFLNGLPQPGRGRRLLQHGESNLPDDIARSLPENLRTCDINPLKIDGIVRGAALVFPSATSAVPVGNRVFSDRLQEARSTIVGESTVMLSAVDIAVRAARSESVSSLLIEGETGVGKELFARLIHAGGQRSEKAPFVALNCGAITRELFGSELFGHVSGAFTGASREGKPGVLERANGGVICLDEIGEMPLEIQPFLLRVLEERVVQRIGDTKGRPVDIKLIASTNRDLKLEVTAGRFRRDLYYRIGAVKIRVPPLRERGDDVLLLLDRFNRKMADETGRDLLKFTPAVLDRLLAYRWPGNVRELKNLVERLHLLARQPRIELDDLPEEIAAFDVEAAADESGAAQSARDNAPFSLEDAEEQAIRNALAADGGNLSKVARRLGISRPTLYRKLDHYGIHRGFV